MSIGADLGRLHDVPRVRVESLTMTVPGITRLSLAATPSEADDPDRRAVAGMFLVDIGDRDPEFAILRHWLEQQSVLGIVIPPDSSIIRLRGLEDLQPVTLRRVDT